jgi:class 3 adenylate cyclase/tetratricopeptide (TPR) repeat protein
MAICERCGYESAAGLRFCGACGAELPAELAPRQTRKVVTALFCDVTGSTALGEELDPEALRAVMNRYFVEIRAVIERHGGTVEKFIGDAVMAVFGIPQVHEDDALRAVRAAAEIRQRLPAIAEQVGVALRFRTGVNTGPVVSGEGENMAIGDAVNVAARLEQAAAPGEILLGEQTLALVRDAVEVQALEPLELKGKTGQVAAFRLVRVDPAAAGLARHLDAPLVGREQELAHLREAWERAVRNRGCHLFTLLGAAGVGKSRLVAELLTEIGEAAASLRGRCLPYGEGITFWPLVEALSATPEAAPVIERLGGVAAAPEELFWEVRRLLESLVLQRPVILWLDDLQWAESMLFDLLDHVADLSRDAPILLMCTARPELLEVRPGWGGGKLNATTMLLEPLAGSDCEMLLDQLGVGLQAAERARVIAASEGNPLFLEEMTALVRERGTVAVPPTIQALLAARLERLGPGERVLLERGAVEGEVFHRLAVRALLGEQPAVALELQLAGLVRKELIRPHPPSVGVDDAFRFRHLLIRDAAYDGLPKATRADLHERFAGWLVESGGDLVELDEIAGWHLEQALRYRHELGQEVEPSLALAAAQRLHAAGRRAHDRSDVAAAKNLLERALAVAPSDDQLHARIGVDLAERLLEGFETARVDELLSDAERHPEAALAAGLVRLEWMMRARPHEAMEALQSRLPGMLEQLEQAGDERGLARAHLVASFMHWTASQAEPCMLELRRATEHARKAGDRPLLRTALVRGTGPLVQGPYHASELGEWLRELSDEPGAFVASRVRLGEIELARLDGRFDDGRESATVARESIEQLGQHTMIASCCYFLGRLELSAGDYLAARAAVLESNEILAAQGERGYRSTRQAELARISELLGDHEAAREALEQAEELGASEDIVNFAITHPVRARLALRDGDRSGAERWAHSAVEIADKTDFSLIRADARLELARILGALERRIDAIAEARAALELYESKGDRPGAGQALGFLEQIAHGANGG